MSGTPSEPDHTSSQPTDWEAFYANYRKPGYIGGYEITSKLGGGMFGLVFKATKQSIGKDYAIKFLKVDDTEVRKAVLNELESVRFFAQVDHPNLVSIEDRGVIDGIPFIIMAYAGGETLRSRLNANECDNMALVRLFLQACRGVHALHERSLVHFDLKPANIFIKGDVARVGDYGLSKLVSASRNSLSMGRGTPYYMAPEMLHRRGDHRSDIYSLGVMLFECMTGEVPFKGDSEWEVLKAHETKEPSYPDDMPVAHRRVIQRCMAKDPVERYETVAEIIRDLQAPTSAAAAAVADLGLGGAGSSGPGVTLPRAAERPSEPKRVKVPPPIPESHRRKVGAEEVVAEISGEAAERDAQLLEQAAANRRRVMNRRRGTVGSSLTPTEVAAERAAEAVRRHRKRPKKRSSNGAVIAVVAVGVLLGLGIIVVTMLAGQSFREEGMRVRDVQSTASAEARRLENEQQFRSVVEGLVRAPVPKAIGTSRGIRRDGSVITRIEPGSAGLQASIPQPVRIGAFPRPVKGVPPAIRVEIQNCVDDLAGRRSYRTGCGREIEEHGYAGFVASVDYLMRLDHDDREDAQRAAMVGKFLSDWTGLKSIELRAPKDRKSPSRGDVKFNRQGVAAWRGVLEHFCTDEKSFESFLAKVRENASR